MTESKKQSLDQFGFGTQIRRSPFFKATVNSGVKGFSVYNHMYIPRDFGNPEQNFWNLINSAILCDVSVERQVEIKGPDAKKFIQFLTPRDLAKCAVGQCKYVLITDQSGGILNDPVLLRLGENHFWLSLADSDILLWAKGVAIHTKMDVKISEPDVSPLQLQGPKSRDIVHELFGEKVSNLGYYRLVEFEYLGIPLLVSRTGWSSELGFEIFLRDGSKGTTLWNEIMKVGKPFGLKPGHTSTIRRVEGAMLSYHADVNASNNPFEYGLDRLVNLEIEEDFIGKEALKKIKKDGIRKKQVGLEIDCSPLLGPNNEFWVLRKFNREIGKVTSAIYSPRLKKNIALAMIDIESVRVGETLIVEIDGIEHSCVQVGLPFYDPKKSIAKQ